MAEQTVEPPFQERLKLVRTLPSGTEVERQKKWEEARDLRIETMLSQADVARRFVNIVEQDPDKSLEDLRQSASSFVDEISQPEVIDKFLEHFEISRGTINKVLNYFRKQANLPRIQSPTNRRNWEMFYADRYDMNSDMQEVAEKIFISITGKKPKAPVTLIPSPYAVIIRTSDSEDLMSLNNGEDAGGFFNEERDLLISTKLLVSGKKTEVVKCPFIVVGDSSYHTKTHEVGHAINFLVRKTLSELSSDGQSTSVWGGKQDLDLPTEPFGEVSDLENYLTKTVMAFALSSAKDELITDLIASQNLLHFLDLNQKGGIYDYFNIALKICYDRNLVWGLSTDEVEKIRDKVWQSYEKQITDANNAVKALLVEYFREDKTKRLALLPYVLTQIPLVKWKSRIEKYFESELSSFRNSKEELEDLVTKAGQYGNYGRNALLKTGILEVIKSATDEYRSAGTKSIFRVARELDEETVKATKKLKKQIPI